LDPIIQAPPFVDDNERREWAFARGRIEHGLHGFVAALVGNGLRGSEYRQGAEEKEQDQSNFHGWPPPPDDCSAGVPPTDEEGASTSCRRDVHITAAGTAALQPRCYM